MIAFIYVSIFITQQIKLLEGRPDGWNVRPSRTPDKELEINNTVAVFWFPSIYHAERWLHYEPKFHVAGFPHPDGADIFSAPINFVAREGGLYQFVIIYFVTYMARVSSSL